MEGRICNKYKGRNNRLFCKKIKLWMRLENQKVMKKN